ncbi:type 1 glutamine amidotransferase [Bradyrhizobium sp.]|uniref:type 1 glutamine amidotransferase n=1 Tax=Bradyrhizobium sp. TaxID=376 RepID=UPI003C573262
MLRLLVAEGNTLEGRRHIAESAGATPAESYAEVLRIIAPEAVVDMCAPADAGGAPPQALESYDGVAITGSSLNIYQREIESLRQIDFVRELFARGIPMFGSCWGLQLATVAAGGEVEPNPSGLEVGFARKIALTDRGRVHPMHADRDVMFDAPAIHGDIVARLPQGAIATARNAMSDVQAAEIRVGQGVFWGVQYHPEYNLHDVAAVIRRYGQALVIKGFFADLAELERYAADLSALGTDRQRRDIAWRLGLGSDILDDRLRWAELSNWIASLVRRKTSRETTK